MTHEWMRTDYEFGGRRMAMIVLRNRHAVAVAEFIKDNCVPAATSDPAVVEKWLTDLIVEVYPKLQGLTLMAMRYDVQTQSYMVAAEHSSFERVPFGEMLPEFEMRE